MRVAPVSHYRRLMPVMLVVSLLTACAAPLSSLTETELEQKAQTGNVQAQYLLARKLADRQDHYRALALMKQVGESSAAMGASRDMRGEAAGQAGDWYSAGLGEPRNQGLARHWWQRASSLGNARASFHLAGLCQQPHGTVPDAACVGRFDTAARQGSAGAQLWLARWYVTRGDDREALSWLKQSATQGEPEALARLAHRYETGSGVDNNPATARRYYTQSANRGYPAAQRWMAQHSQGDEVLAWYRRAADAGDPTAQRWLAQAYLAGNGVLKNDAQGLAWLQRAASTGDPQGQYLYSQYQTRDDLKEHSLLLAAQGGDLQAAHALAERYESQGDDVHARAAWQALADRGDAAGRYRYAEMLRLGLGGKADYAQAFKQYRLSGMAGNVPAQYRSGMLCQQGLGTPRNRVHAYAWYALAATENRKEAVAALDALEKQLQGDEIKAGQKLATDWSRQITHSRHEATP